jgi:hypothetical protein
MRKASDHSLFSRCPDETMDWEDLTDDNAVEKLICRVSRECSQINQIVNLHLQYGVEPNNDPGSDSYWYNLLFKQCWPPYASKERK